MNDLNDTSVEDTLNQAISSAEPAEKGQKTAPVAGNTTAATSNSAPTVPPVKAAKSVGTRVLPELVEVAIEKNIRVLLTKTGYEFEGFYKGGPMRVEPDANGNLLAIDRKEKKVALKGFDDLARLNYDWWKKSRDKGAEFINPSKEWTDEFVRLNLVKRQVIFIPGED